jgi:hypothetical protein
MVITLEITYKRNLLYFTNSFYTLVFFYLLDLNSAIYKNLFFFNLLNTLNYIASKWFITLKRCVSEGSVTKCQGRLESV